MDAKGRDATSPWHMPWAAWKAVGVRTWNESGEDNIGLIAAGVAFYGFLALVPMLGAIVLCYGLFADTSTVIENVRGLTAFVPRDVALTIGEQLLGVVQAPDQRKGFGLVIALAITMFGARNGAGAVIAALNVAYEEHEKRNILVLNLTSLAITAAAVLGAVLAALAITALSAASKLMGFLGPVLPVVIAGTTYVLLTLAGAAGAAALYRFGPSRHKPRWVWITPGSLFTAVLWLLLTLGFGAYAANIGKFDATYGSLGAIVALMTWLYLSSYVLLFGAELNAELEHQTARDTTIGKARPLGERKAWVADHIADVPLPQPTMLPVPQVLAAPPPPAAPNPIPAADPGQEPGFVAARVGARVGRLAGLPKTGWISSGLASIGLAMLRKRGRKATGAALLATAAGLSLLTTKE